MIVYFLLCKDYNGEKKYSGLKIILMLHFLKWDSFLEFAVVCAITHFDVFEVLLKRNQVLVRI